MFHPTRAIKPVWRRFALFWVVLLLCLSFIPDVKSAPDPNISLIRQAANAIERGQWQQARKLAAQASDPAAKKLVTYLYLTSGKAAPGFAEIAAFLIANPNWPSQRELVVRAEHSLPETMPLRERVEWFRRWRYDPSFRKAQDQELLLRAWLRWREQTVGAITDIAHTVTHGVRTEVAAIARGEDPPARAPSRAGP